MLHEAIWAAESAPTRPLVAHGKACLAAALKGCTVLRTGAAGCSQLVQKFKIWQKKTLKI
jgi:hypothetical protein